MLCSMVPSRISHVVGFDDAPFGANHRGDVLVVGAVFAGPRMDGVLSGKVRRDGVNATRVLTGMVAESRFHAHLQLILLQGIALAGFNVVDIHALSEALKLPVLVICRKCPDLHAIRYALLERVPGGARKWALIEKAGPMEAYGGIYLQRAGIDKSTAGAVVQRLAINNSIPEPLRTAHMIAGGIANGESQHRV